jgi:hypothetical protein
VRLASAAVAKRSQMRPTISVALPEPTEQINRLFMSDGARLFGEPRVLLGR